MQVHGLKIIYLSKHIKPLFEFHFTEMKDGGSSFVHGQLFFW